MAAVGIITCATFVVPTVIVLYRLIYSDLRSLNEDRFFIAAGKWRMKTEEEEAVQPDLASRNI